VDECRKREGWVRSAESSIRPSTQRKKRQCELRSSRPRLRSMGMGIYSAEWNTGVLITTEVIEERQSLRWSTDRAGIDCETI
jgi:hypothetical protein